MSKIIIVFIVSCLTVLVNVPMGYWRSAVRKYSIQWFLAIHLAVPLIFLLRTKAGLGYTYIPELLVSAVLGQMIGGKLSA